MAIKFIKRDDVKARFLAKWADAIKLARETGLPFRVPDWDRLRNYEMEMDMHDYFGDDWVVAEWCPFNGIYCAYLQGASKYDLKTARRNIARVDDPILNKDAIFKTIDDQLARRPDDLGEKQCWGQGIVEYLKKFEEWDKQ